MILHLLLILMCLFFCFSLSIAWESGGAEAPSRKPPPEAL